MFAKLLDRIRNEDEVGVPHRFSMGTIFVLLTLYAMLFRLLVLIGAEANWTGVICLFFAAVTLGQMVLFQGTRPRAASVIVGAVTCPTILLLIVIDEATTKWTGMTPMAGELGRIGMFASALVLLSFLGLGFGYVVGGMMASVFYVIGKLRPATGIAGLETTTTPQATEPLLANWASKLGRFINPYQPRTPLRGAFAILWVVTALGFLLAPFVFWMASRHVMLIAVGLAVCLAIWSGNFQLWFTWPVALAAVGCFVAIWPANALKDAAFQEMFVSNMGSPDVFTELMMVLGGFIGFTVSAIAGWLQWFRYRKQAKNGFGGLVLTGFALLLVGIGWLASNRATEWVQSPTQLLLRKIMADGGHPYWMSPFDWRLRGVSLSEKSNDNELINLLPQVVVPMWIDLAGENFTDSSVAALEGMHLQFFAVNGVSITNAAFDELRDFSSSSISIANCRVGDDVVTGMLKLPQVPRVLEALNMDGSDVTGDGLRQLQVCGSLKTLSISRCPQMVDSELTKLSVLPRLTLLILSGSPVTDDGLEKLVKSAPRLRQLLLDGCTEITDEGLAHLTNIKSLRSVRCTGTQVTSKGVEGFRSALPGCGLVWDDPDDD